MTFNYARPQATADRLIQRYGQAISLKKYSSTGDAWNPTRTATTTSLYAAVLDYNQSEIDGTLILIDDKRVYISAKDNVSDPAKGDVLVFGGRDHAIINLNTFQPAGIIVYYEAQCRKI